MATFARLLGFLRPYRPAVVASFALAALAMLATVAIPALTERNVFEASIQQAQNAQAYLVLERPSPAG